MLPEFRGASYRDRYSIFVEKLLRERLYDGACLLLTNRESARTGAFTEPHPELTFRRFAAALISHAAPPAL